MKSKEKERLFQELSKCSEVLEEYDIYGKCQSYEDLRLSGSPLLQSIYMLVEGLETSYSDQKLFEKFTSILNM
jgi:uncharacterized protein YutD